MSVIVEVSESAKTINKFISSSANTKDSYKASDVIAQSAIFSSTKPKKDGKQHKGWLQIIGMDYRAKNNFAFDKLELTRNPKPYMEEGQEHSLEAKTNHMWIPAGEDTQVGILCSMIEAGLTSESVYNNITEPLRTENKKLKNETWTFSPLIKKKEITSTPDDGEEYTKELYYKSPAIKVDIPIDEECNLKWVEVELRQKIGEDDNGKSQYQMNKLSNIHISEFLRLLRFGTIIKPTVSFYKVWVGGSKLNGSFQYGVKCSLKRIIIYNDVIPGQEVNDDDDDDEIIVSNMDGVEETKENIPEPEEETKYDEEETEEEEEEEGEESEDDD